MVQAIINFGCDREINIEFRSTLKHMHSDAHLATLNPSWPLIVHYSVMRRELDQSGLSNTNTVDSAPQLFQARMRASQDGT